MTSPRRGAPALSRMFPPIPKPDPAELLRDSREGGGPHATTTEASAAEPLDLEGRPRSLTVRQGIMVGAFTHIPYFVLIGLLHLRVNPLAMFFLLFTTERYARGDYQRFARRALVFGVLAAAFCAWLQFVVQPHHP